MVGCIDDSIAAPPRNLVGVATKGRSATRHKDLFHHQGDLQSAALPKCNISAFMTKQG
jgi:hypothetical protein